MSCSVVRWKCAGFPEAPPPSTIRVSQMISTLLPDWRVCIHCCDNLSS